MLRFLKILVITLGAILVLFFLAGLLMPSEYHVERSVVIEASPEIIHTFVGDLEHWDRWTPWKEMDPTIEVTFGETTTGIGASQTWTGTSGNGELTFTNSSAMQGVAYNMSFDGDTYVSEGILAYEPSAAGTEVTWIMDGEVGISPIDRLFSLMMDSMVGPSFEKGLARLKELSEDEARAAAALSEGGSEDSEAGGQAEEAGDEGSEDAAAL